MRLRALSEGVNNFTKHRSLTKDKTAHKEMDVEGQGVYRTVDESGRVVYTDRPPAPKAPAVKMKTPAQPSYYEYELARLRAETERYQADGLAYENRQRRPIVVYDPQGVQR